MSMDWEFYVRWADFLNILSSPLRLGRPIKVRLCSLERKFRSKAHAAYTASVPYGEGKASVYERIGKRS